MTGVKTPKRTPLPAAVAPPVAPPVADTARVVSADDVTTGIRQKRLRQLRFLTGVSSAYDPSVLGGAING